MLEFIPAAVIFLLEVVLLVLWFRSRRCQDGQERWLCFWGFLVGQVYLLWEVWQVKQTGKPLPGSAEQQMLMGRLVLGTSLGGLFTIMGLFYLSFAVFRKGQ
ncbi:hypothetical protein [Marinicella meishanensis]|uniref:hypothetical protein n=1 Tax=Marinicella meishanensis TaxID=2873263 RepID=UPI001CC10BE0|nr:hypothetical protein [Marinicella sp. NBU2979]